MTSPVVLAVLAIVIVALALVTSSYHLLLANLLLLPFELRREVSGVWIDSSDLIFAGMALTWAIGRWDGGGRRRIRIPRLGWWIAYGAIVSLAYLWAPANQAQLTDPVRGVYQVYRYCWKPILYFPLAVLLLRDPSRLRAAIGVVIVAADICSLQGILQGFRGEQATGPFDTGNSLGGALLMPLVLALGAFVTAPTRRQRFFYGISLLLLLRALTFSYSRGALVAFGVGAVVILAGLWWRQRERRPVIRRLALYGAGLAILIPILRPDFLERTTVQRILSLRQGSAVETFQWRMQERWPYFIQRVQEKPWLGTGLDYDPELGDSAITPHNGYLAKSLSYGIPAALVFVLLIGSGARAGSRALRSARRPEQRAFGLIAAAALLSLLVHNLVDGTFGMPFVGAVAWMLTAAALRHEEIFSAAPAAAPARAGRLQPVGAHSMGGMG